MGARRLRGCTGPGAHVLDLRLGASAPAGAPRSDGSHVLWWPVVATTATTAVLQRRSRWGIDATLLFSTHAGGVTFSSAMVFHRRLGRAMWFAVAPAHRWAVRLCLGRAQAR